MPKIKGLGYSRVYETLFSSYDNSVSNSGIIEMKGDYQMCHWSTAQQDRFVEVLSAQERGECVVALWNSDAHGFPVNHVTAGCWGSEWRAEPGKVQEVEGPLTMCSGRALHATHDPLSWKGCRVWVVALWWAHYQDGDKMASLKREILGEILPSEAFSSRVGARLGRTDLSGADLSKADFYRANLYRANLSGVDLSGANLSGANLSGANLYRANLSGANLSGANLYGANLSRANLSRANLSGVNLYGVDLSGANLYRADLYGANLYGANLPRADL